MYFHSNVSLKRISCVRKTVPFLLCVISLSFLLWTHPKANHHIFIRCSWGNGYNADIESSYPLLAILPPLTHTLSIQYSFKPICSLEAVAASRANTLFQLLGCTSCLYSVVPRPWLFSLGDLDQMSLEVFYNLNDSMICSPSMSR